MTSRLPIRDLAGNAIERAWASAIAAGTLPPLPDDAAAPEVEVERPASEEHGDLATNLAMKLARPYRMSPLAIATALADELMNDSGADLFASATVAAPGFVNLRLAESALEDVVGDVLAAPEAWGRSTAWGEPRIVNVEFVSANPTGPLHVGNARGAFVGDLLCRVLEAGGQRVTREYYFNDSGGQIGDPRRFGRGAAPRRAAARRGLQGRLRGRAGRRAAGRCLGDRDRHPAPTRPLWSADGPLDECAKGSNAASPRSA